MSAPPIGRRFQRGNPGRPRGIHDKRRTSAGIEVATALASGAWDVIEALLKDRSWRARYEAAKCVLSYSIGLPKATLEVQGGFGDLGVELAAALKEARARRAALDAPAPVAAISAAPEAVSEDSIGDVNIAEPSVEVAAAVETA